MNTVSPSCAAGKADWRLTYIHELTGIPGTRHDDHVDSISQFINWAEERFSNGFNLSPIPWAGEKEEFWLE